MRTALPQQLSRKQSHRPRAVTVFAAAFVAGAAAAVGVNRALDVRLAQAKPRVESEAIFVALRSLPQGTPVTVWDVALRDWPKAMLPASALRAHDSFTGQVLRHPLREGQPLLAIQLVPASSGTSSPADAQPTPPPAAYTQVSAPVKPPVEADLWAPAEPAAAPAAAPPVTAESQPTPPADTQPSSAAAASAPVAQETVAWPQPTVAAVVAEPAQAVEPPAAQVGGGETLQPSVAAEAIAASTDTAATTPAPQAESVVPTPIEQPTVAAAEQPAPLATADEPSVAQPPTETAAVSQTPTIVADIVAPEPVAEPVSVVAAAPSPPPVAEAAVRPLPRYLVVPENIAVQADRSFAIPSTAIPSTSAPTAQSPRPVSGTAGVQQLPPTTGSTVAAPRTRPSVQPAQQQRQAVGQEPRQQQRQGRQPSPATGAGNDTGTGPTSQPRLGAAMFPNISAGIGAIEGEWGRLRRDRTTAEEQPAQRQRPVTAR